VERFNQVITLGETPGKRTLIISTPSRVEGLPKILEALKYYV